RYCDHVAIAILLVADSQLFEVSVVVHIPPEYYRAETESIFCNGEKLLLGHQLSAQDAVDVDAGELDLGVICEELRKGLERRLGGVVFFLSHEYVKCLLEKKTK